MDVAARRRPGAGTVLGTFLYMWMLIGLIVGTAVLIGPVRWITEALHHAGWQQNREDKVLIAVILVFIAASLVITRYAVGFMFRTRSRTLRLAVGAVTTMVAAAVAWEWSNPTKLLASVAGGDVRSAYNVKGGAEFIFGAYPDDERLKSLKREGVTSIVSLQHPGVVIELEGI